MSRKSEKSVTKALNSSSRFRQEIDRMQRMLSLLRRTLTDLVMAIEGTIIMSDDLKEVLDNMFDAKVWQGLI